MSLLGNLHNALGISSAPPPPPKVSVGPGAKKLGARPDVAPQAPPSNWEQGIASSDNGMGGIYGEREDEARGLSVDALGLSRQAAMGQAPSQAEILGRYGLDRAAADQQSLAASARGPAALALAQQQAAFNTANIQQQGSAQMAALRAQEMANARNEYAQGAAGLQGRDQNMYGMGLQRGTSQAELENQYQAQRNAWDIAKANAGQQVQDRAMGWIGGQTAGRTSGYNAQLSADQAAAQAAYDKKVADQQARSGLLKGVAQGAMGALNSAAGALSGAGGLQTGAQGGGNQVSAAQTGAAQTYQKADQSKSTSNSSGSIIK